jgi:hypothetical protein
MMRKASLKVLSGSCCIAGHGPRPTQAARLDRSKQTAAYATGAA